MGLGRSRVGAAVVDRRDGCLARVIASARSAAAIVFPGDRRVWRAAAAAALPMAALVAFYCLRPRDYFTGTDNVEAYTYVALAHPGEPLCVPGLAIPGGTGASVCS